MKSDRRYLRKQLRHLRKQLRVMTALHDDALQYIQVLTDENNSLSERLAALRLRRFGHA